MNDDTREKLSAYIDGALDDAQRRALEVEIARSEDLRRELEALRAVSGAVKGLPREPLPSGFMARLQARRAGETSPARDWVFLPPAYRPVAAALSMAVVALVVWDKAHAPVELPAQKGSWDGGADDRIAVKTAAEMPTSMDVSGRLAAMNQAAAPAELKSLSATRDEAAPKIAVAPPGHRAAAPGKPIGIVEEPDQNTALAGAGGAALVKSSFEAAPAADKDAGSSSYQARTEEERSAINEHLYKGFEDEKKRMGIAKIIDKDDKDAADQPARSAVDTMALQAPPEAPQLAQGRQVASVRGAAKMGALSAGAPMKKKAAAEPLAPVKAIALKSPEALQAAWAAAGLTGELPAVKFPDQMAIFLAGPQGCGIVSIQNRRKFLVVLYKATGFDDPSARIRAVTVSAKPVVVKLAEE